jgi:hypothetical protein
LVDGRDFAASDRDLGGFTGSMIRGKVRGEAQRHANRAEGHHGSDGALTTPDVGVLSQKMSKRAQVDIMRELGALVVGLFAIVMVSLSLACGSSEPRNESPG